MKRLVKYSNFLIFSVAVLGVFLLQSHTHLSTSLLSILPEGEAKTMIQSFNTSQNSKTLLLAVKGSDEKALQTIQTYEKALLQLPLLEKKTFSDTLALQTYKEKHLFSVYPLNAESVKVLNVDASLKSLYEEMTSSFLPIRISKHDPFSLLQYPEAAEVEMKEGYLLLKGYGVMRTFTVKSQSLEGHETLYRNIKNIVQNSDEVKVFSPFFYYVENSQAIRKDVNTIMLLALTILLLLYLYLLRDISLLLNTLATLGTSALLATLILSQLYEEISIFVLVFGISISTIAIDYMFHHYLHDYYVDKKVFNKEVLFGYLTTISAFFILSFTDFLLIKQISLFAMLSLSFSYLHFAFLYPHIHFKAQEIKEQNFSIPFSIKPKYLLLFSLVVILSSLSWLRFDFDLAHLDYDNQTLKEDEAFFLSHLDRANYKTFALKASTLEQLVDEAKALEETFSSAKIPLSSLASQKVCLKNKQLLESQKELKRDLLSSAQKLGFKKAYFDKAYQVECSDIKYTLSQIHAMGITVFQIDTGYVSYGQIAKDQYSTLLNDDAVESLSLKERFETSMKKSMERLALLGVLALVCIVFLLYMVTGTSIAFALLFLLFPLAMSALYAYSEAFNILHLFMLFILLSIGIDYGIYLSKKNDTKTRTAIRYSLISTFAGFGVLVFSSISALYSLGVIATIGIVSIFILLVFVKGEKDAS